MMALDRVVYWLVLAFPVTIISIKVLGPLIYLLLALIGIYWTISRRVSPFSIRELRLFSWLTFGYFIVMALSVVLSNEPTNDWMHLSRKVQFLIAPFVGLAIYYVKVPLRSLTRSLKVGLIVIGSIVLVQYILGGYGARLSGMFNPNTFGDIATVMVMLGISRAYTEEKQEYLFTLLALIFGVVAIVLSGSRGSVLSLVVALLFYGVLSFFYFKSYFKNWIIVLLVALNTLTITSYVTDVSTRSSIVGEQVRQWDSGENTQTSIGIRLEMYTAGWQAFIDAPIIGYGYRNANIVVARYAPKASRVAISHYSHLHNEYLTNAVSAGIVGLTMLLILFLLPLKLFFSSLLNKKNKAAIAGIFLIGGFMLNGIFHASLQWEYQNSFFPFFLSIFFISTLNGRANVK